MSPHDLQTAAIDAGYAIKAPNGEIIITQPMGLYWLCHEHGVLAAVVDLAFGLKQGAVFAWVAEQNLPTLNGYTGRNRPGGPRALPPGVNRTYGSGIEGTPGQQAEAAQPYGPEYLPPKPDRLAEFAEYVKQARWQIPGNEREVRADAHRMGLTQSEAEEALQLAPGSLGAQP